VAAAARAWQREVQRLADERGLSIEVHRSPPGTNKRNKIEPCLASSRSSAGLAGLAIQRADFHGEWNDPIAPSNRHN
jgi:hypothetical protein